MYECMNTIYTRKRCNKLMKEVQVKCESEKVPEADSAPRNRS